MLNVSGKAHLLIFPLIILAESWDAVNRESGDKPRSQLASTWPLYQHVAVERWKGDARLSPGAVRQGSGQTLRTECQQFSGGNVPNSAGDSVWARRVARWLLTVWRCEASETLSLRILRMDDFPCSSPSLWPCSFNSCPLSFRSEERNRRLWVSAFLDSSSAHDICGGGLLQMAVFVQRGAALERILKDLGVTFARCRLDCASNVTREHFAVSAENLHVEFDEMNEAFWTIAC